jgi:hypothetical protein
MTPTEAVVLTEYVRDCCPQQVIGEYTHDIWYDILSDLELTDCRAAVIAIKRRAVFVDPSEIRAEVRRIRNDRLSRQIVPAPPPELAENPVRFRETLKADLRAIADGRAIPEAIAGPVREDDPPPTWAQARAVLSPPRTLTPQEKAAQQAAESRAAREAAQRDEDPAA